MWLLLLGDPKYSEVEVDIEVQDTNDNPPQIGSLPDNILISEATLVGSHVVTVTATDKDTGSNGIVSFYGYSPEGLFAIDVKTGAVKTIGIFDFEKKSKYVLSFSHFIHPYLFSYLGHLLLLFISYFMYWVSPTIEP